MNIGCLRDCGRAAYCRGLCNRCYRALLQRLRSSQTTEAAEVAARRLAPNRKAEGYAKAFRMGRK